VLLQLTRCGSALGQKADLRGHITFVCFVPIADMGAQQVLALGLDQGPWVRGDDVHRAMRVILEPSRLRLYISPC